MQGYIYIYIYITYIFKYVLSSGEKDSGEKVLGFKEAYKEVTEFNMSLIT